MVNAIGRNRSIAVVGVLLAMGSVGSTRAAVTLALRDANNATSHTYNGGDSFSLTVYLSITSANDNNVAAIDYQVGTQLNGKDVSGVFNLLSRATTTSDPATGNANSGSNNGFISDPNYKDSNPNIPGPLHPNNGTNLGGSNLDGNVLTGVHTNNSISTLTFKVNSGIQYGAYVLSFYLPNADTQYTSVSGMNIANHSFDSLGTYTATAPEPSGILLAMGALAPMLKRSRLRSPRI